MFKSKHPGNRFRTGARCAVRSVRGSGAVPSAPALECSDLPRQPENSPLEETDREAEAAKGASENLHGSCQCCACQARCGML